MSRTLNRYVNRATLGLPRHERVEMAAELRTHLVDRVQQLEAEGFSREEAEHLAVQGMGDAKVTNRQLLGHIFTTTLGWSVLTALLVAGGGWWVWQNMPLPFYGQSTWRWSPELTTQDLTALQQQASAPRAPYVAGDLTIPTRTAWLYMALLPRTGGGMAMLNIHNLQFKQGSDSHSPVLNGKLGVRILLSAEPWTAACPLKNGAKQMQIYALIRSSSPDLNLEFQMGGQNSCTGVVLPRAQDLPGGYSTFWQKTFVGGPLPMNGWTVLAAYVVDTGMNGAKIIDEQPNNPHDYVLAVMPANKPLHRAPDARFAEVLTKGSGLSVMTDAAAWGKDSFGLPRPSLAKAVP